MRLVIFFALIGLVSGCASFKELSGDCACLEKPINPPASGAAWL